jgi:hypothetical protein
MFFTSMKRFQFLVLAKQLTYDRFDMKSENDHMEDM